MSQGRNNLGDHESMVSAFATLDERMRQAAINFTHVSDASVRISEKTNMIIRSSLFAAMLLTPFLFYMIFTLTLDMTQISSVMRDMDAHMAGMSGHFDTVASSTNAMRGQVIGMSESIAVLPQIDGTVFGMQEPLGNMTDTMQQLRDSMQGMDDDMRFITHNVSGMNDAFSQMNRSVFSMQNDIGTLSRPAQMMPFNW
jgi:prophage DNA circulation protein